MFNKKNLILFVGVFTLCVGVFSLDMKAQINAKATSSSEIQLIDSDDTQIKDISDVPQESGIFSKK